MKRIYFLPIVFAIAFIFQACEKDSPEDTPQLYMDEVFTSVTKTTVTYSDTFGFEMDIYSPNDKISHVST